MEHGYPRRQQCPNFQSRSEVQVKVTELTFVIHYKYSVYTESACQIGRLYVTKLKRYSRNTGKIWGPHRPQHIFVNNFIQISFVRVRENVEMTMYKKHGAMN